MQGLAAPHPLGGRASTGKNVGNKSISLVYKLHVQKPGTDGAHFGCWAPGTSLPLKGKHEAGKPTPRGPRPGLPSPSLGPARWGLRRGPARSVAIPPTQPAPLSPKLGTGPPPQPTLRARVRVGPHPPGPRRPRPADSSLPSPRGGGDSAALPQPSRRRPQQAPCPLRPAAADRTSGARWSPAEVSGGGSAGGRKPRRRRELHSRPGTFQCGREGLSCGACWKRSSGAPRVTATPKLRA